jgi:hypothetical protein
MHAHVCTCVHVCAHTSVVVGWPASVSMHTRARLCTRASVSLRPRRGVRAYACTCARVCPGVCDGWLACKRVHTRARVCPYMFKRVVGRASTRVHTRARVCMHAGTVWGGVVVYVGGGGWVRVGVVGCESQAFLKRLARAASRRTRPEGSGPRSCVMQLVLITTRATKVSRKDHAMSNKQIIKDRIMERARVHGMGRRARVHGKDLGGRVYEARLARLLATTCLMHVESSFVG